MGSQRKDDERKRRTLHVATLFAPWYTPLISHFAQKPSLLFDGLLPEKEDENSWVVRIQRPRELR
jgi:hypothetical protein